MTFHRFPIASLILSAAAATVFVRAQGQAPQPPPVVPKSLVDKSEPVTSCETLKSVTLPNTTIDAAVVDPGNQTIPASCRVTATVTHPPADDRVKIWIGLPMTNWNGRFQGVGGGGFSGGSANGVAQPLRAGYAAGSTDTGHEGGSGSFALDANGQLNWQLIRDNAYLGIHDMTVTGKALVQTFYGTPPQKSYFNGCSTGGRQGLSEAQRYPADYDGILSGAPAINFAELHVAQLWGHLVMLEAKTIVPPCKFVAATEAAVAACDAIDGVKDGVIGDPSRCQYDPKALVGASSATCGAITDADADIIRKIWDGPHTTGGKRLWYGLPRGAAFALSNTGGNPPAGQPFPITLDWFRYFLTQNPKWDWTTITRGSYEQFFSQSVKQFNDIIGTNNPNLSAFRKRSGKIIMWHGWSDQLIYAGGSIDYFTKVQAAAGGASPTASFLRFFLAPGVAHCGGGAGPAPSGQFEAVVKWVEEGQAPETLTAVRRDNTGAVTRSRPLCPYPLVARYKGSGSTDDAANFECRAGL
jgi:feruloyl esterase